MPAHCMLDNKAPPHTHTHTHSREREREYVILVAFQQQQLTFVHTLPVFYIVIFKFGVIFDELNSIFSVFVCYFIYIYIYI